MKGYLYVNYDNMERDTEPVVPLRIFNYIKLGLYCVKWRYEILDFGCHKRFIKSSDYTYLYSSFINKE